MPSSTSISVAAIRVVWNGGDPATLASVMDRGEALVRDAAAQGAELAVLPEHYRALLGLNPLYWLVAALRAPLYEGTAPSAEVRRNCRRFRFIGQSSIALR